MIQYTLRCDQAHSFDSWFKSSEAFDKLASAGLLSCAVCGSAGVVKAMMSPRVTSARTAATARGNAAARSSGPAVPERRPVALAAAPELQRALAEIRKRVEAQSDYVGDRFVQEARAMHLGEAPERSIYGEATATDARQLVEDGVPVMPLPFIPVRKTN